MLDATYDPVCLLKRARKYETTSSPENREVIRLSSSRSEDKLPRFAGGVSGEDAARLSERTSGMYCLLMNRARIPALALAPAHRQTC